MNEIQRAIYEEDYKHQKERGEAFFPYTISADVAVSLLVLLVLIALSIFRPAVSEGIADPSNTAYVPRPEWYFMFLFQFLKYVPGSVEGWVIGAIPVVALGLLVAVPFLDHGPYRHPLNRPLATLLGVLVVLAMVFLTWKAYQSTPAAAKAALALLGPARLG
ncbi:MAG: hypothetical protein IRZ26_06145 [Clostridia bacterium]|nr:hypothetical protein [Clostridia bacterium]